MDAEALAARFVARTGRSPILRSVLASDVAWRLSGLTYASAVMATTGSYLDVPTYVAAMRTRMAQMRWFVPDHASVLDFGTGMGGNLFGMVEFLERGVGLDINPFYVSRARGIARRLGLSQLRFLSYDGHHLPDPGAIDLVLAIGTFERLPPSQVERYLRTLRSLPTAPRRYLVYFLTTAARENGFGRVLGADRYTFWTEPALDRLFGELGLRVVRATPGLTGLGTTYFLEAG